MLPLKSVVFGVFGVEALENYYILFSKKPKSGYKWLVAIFQRIGGTLISNCLKIIIRKEKKKVSGEAVFVRCRERGACRALSRSCSVVSAGDLSGP